MISLGDAGRFARIGELGVEGTSRIAFLVTSP
jgi:hypothetical protein